MECPSTLSIVIKNADGITPDFVLRKLSLSGTRICHLKNLLCEQYEGQPEEGSLKLVHSGRFVDVQDDSAMPVDLIITRCCTDYLEMMSYWQTSSNW